MAPKSKLQLDLIHISELLEQLNRNGLARNEEIQVEILKIIDAYPERERGELINHVLPRNYEGNNSEITHPLICHLTTPDFFLTLMERGGLPTLEFSLYTSALATACTRFDAQAIRRILEKIEPERQPLACAQVIEGITMRHKRGLAEYISITDVLSDAQIQLAHSSNQKNALMMALKSGDLAFLAHCKQLPFNYHETDARGRSTLFYAIDNEDQMLVGKCLSDGVQVTEKDLTAAVTANNFDLAQLLLQQFNPEAKINGAELVLITLHYDNDDMRHALLQHNAIRFDPVEAAYIIAVFDPDVLAAYLEQLRRMKIDASSISKQIQAYNDGNMSRIELIAHLLEMGAPQTDKAMLYAFQSKDLDLIALYGNRSSDSPKEDFEFQQALQTAFMSFDADVIQSFFDAHPKLDKTGHSNLKPIIALPVDFEGSTFVSKLYQAICESGCTPVLIPHDRWHAFIRTPGIMDYFDGVAVGGSARADYPFNAHFTGQAWSDTSDSNLPNVRDRFLGLADAGPPISDTELDTILKHHMFIAEDIQVDGDYDVSYGNANEIEMILFALKAQKPLMTMCGGTQLMALTNGGALAPAYEHMTYSEDDIAHGVALDTTSRAYEIAQTEEIAANSHHNYQVKEVPGGYMMTGQATSLDGRMLSEGTEIIEPSTDYTSSVHLSFQFHPEDFAIQKDAAAPVNEISRGFLRSFAVECEKNRYREKYQAEFIERARQAVESYGKEFTPSQAALVANRRVALHRQIQRESRRASGAMLTPSEVKAHRQQDRQDSKKETAFLRVLTEVLEIELKGNTDAIKDYVTLGLTTLHHDHMTMGAHAVVESSLPRLDMSDALAGDLSISCQTLLDTLEKAFDELNITTKNEQERITKRLCEVSSGKASDSHAFFYEIESLKNEIREIITPGYDFEGPR